MLQEKKEFHVDVWPEVYASRQNRMVLAWPAVGVEKFALRVRGENNEPRLEKALCLTVQKGDVRGLIPLQESGIEPGEGERRNRNRLLNLVGQEVCFIVTGIDLENGLFLASRKAVIEALSKEVWQGLKPGDVKEAVARRPYLRPKNGVLVPRGFVVELSGVEALLPIWEISHGWVDELSDFIQPGDRFDVRIKSVDPEEKRLLVSIKDLIPNPWPGAAARHPKGAYRAGVVTGVVRYGIFVELEPGVSALCRHMRDTFPRKGDTVLLVVTDVELEDGAGRIYGQAIKVIRRAS